MEHEHPEEFDWINIKFLETVVRTYKNDDTIQVITYTTQSCFKQRFASILFPCRIDFKSLKYSKIETLNVIVKAQPNNKAGIITFTDGPLFDNEISMYSTTIPAINKLFERAGFTNTIAPNLIYTTKNPFPIIILDDLTRDGFSAPSLPVYDIVDSKLIIQRLAQFHAASYYLSEMKELNLTNYNYCFYESDTLMKTFRTDVLQPFRDVLETWDGYQHFIPKIDSFIRNIGEIGGNCYKANKSGTGYNVLNHGDFHTQNTMMRLSPENRLENFYFIDFQLSVFCSPAIDLAYITSMVKRDENGEIPFEELVVFYHDNFVEALKRFGFSKPIPTLLDLNNEILRHGQINIVIMILFIPFVFIDLEKANTGNTTIGDDRTNFRRNLYNNPTYKQLIQRSLKIFLQKGWL